MDDFQTEPAPVYKVLLFLKRRPGMSVEAFRDYYENTHSKLGEKYSRRLLRYIRRLDPVGEEELPFDVITELWVSDRATADAIAAQTAKNAPPPDVLEDEKRLFDRSKLRVATVVEFDSSLGPLTDYPESTELAAGPGLV